MSARLRYTIDGPDDRPLLLLGNSLGTTTTMWDAALPTLTRHFRVIRFDHRGHGGSESPPPPWSIADLGADVVGLLDELGIARVSYAGVSLGGMVGMWLAANEPDRVDRLVIVCSSACLGASGAWHARASTVRNAGLEPLADGIVSRWFTAGFAQRRPDVVAQFREMLVSSPRHGYAACCDVLANFDLRSELGDIRASTLVVAGADDEAIRVAHSAAIADAVPGTRLFVVRDAAHLANVEQHGPVAEAIVEHVLMGPIREDA